MNADQIEKINQRVCREYPEMKGVKPSISSERENSVLVYKNRVTTPAGQMSRVVKVVADSSGKIIRLSTSK